MSRYLIPRMLLVIVMVSSGVRLQGQGTIGFDNSGASPEQRVYVDEWLNPAALVPGGGQFLVALYFAPVDGDEPSLVQVGSAATFVGTAEQRYGLFFGGTRTVSTIGIGEAGFFQVKAWEASYGNTYEEALSNPSARTGKSSIFIADTADRFIALEPVFGLVPSSHPDRPFRGFVIAVPEPSTGVLLLAGLATALVVISSKGRKRARASRLARRD